LNSQMPGLRCFTQPLSLVEESKAYGGSVGKRVAPKKGLKRRASLS